MPLTANKIFRIEVESDKLTATLSVNGNQPPGALPPEEIEKEIAALKIKVTEDGRERIRKFAAALAESAIPEPIVIARGTPPKHDENGKIEKLFQAIAEENQSQVDRQSHYERTDIITVKKDQPLVRYIPPVAGKDGVDVYGKKIPRKLGRDAQLRPGVNTRLEGDMIVAAANGKVEITSEKIWVDPKLTINGHVDFSSGNIEFDGDVEIRKNVLDLFKVHSNGNVTVYGVIEAAEVHAAGELNAVGGMAGKEKGNFSAGGNLNAKYITNATVKIGGNAKVLTEVVHSDIICSGRMEVENGPLVGGRTVARGGFRLRHLGSDAGTKTIIEAGIDEAIRLKLDEVEPEIKQRLRKAEKVKQVVEPLLQNQKYLNQEQKEKATELLFNASELEDEARSLVNELREVYEKAQEKSVPEVEVSGRVYCGSIIRFPRLEGRVTVDLNGPLKIAPSMEDGIMRVVAKDLNTGATHVLESGINIDDMWDRLEKTLEH